MTTAVKQEATSWRDEALSRRHRLWGFDAPFVDLDFPVIEFDTAKPKALVEYKHDGPGQTPWLELRGSASIAALRELADAAAVPLIAAYYTTDPWAFTVYPGNLYALRALDLPGMTPTESRELDEAGWVALIYALRDRQPPEQVLANIAQLGAIAAAGVCSACGNGVAPHEMPAPGWPIVCSTCAKKAVVA